MGVLLKLSNTWEWSFNWVNYLRREQKEFI
jgi:hypothetical protein